jgi:hypothetical protein
LAICKGGRLQAYCQGNIWNGILVIHI